ncbi:hypothetical protein FACS189421_08060 [Bacteroidia bacterium]|nr:hypothetical protein FACS189421_08060 [Bacteroidia bacterium]GHT03872.1 hypothetical protein FACS189423_05690 [Bacteroidia bacterium]GHT49865.1 hypothetical protein FACS189440_16310 [Bacteroidia bacterium]GHT89265.1 hypothetical protein FACS189474_5760 [Bacteroidia bacterium]
MDNNLLPFRIQQLIHVIIEKKKYGLEDALQYLYSSELYRQLSSETSSLWYMSLSSLSLYEMLKKEKLSKKHTQSTDSAILLFQVFCLEKYKNHVNIPADEVLQIFIRYDVFEYLQKVFGTLHTQGENYIVTEIETYIKNQQKSEQK